MLFANDGSVVDIAQIVAFYEKIRGMVADKQELSDRIRRFAVEHVSMESAMKPIIEYIQKG